MPKFQGENEFANGWFFPDEGEWYKETCKSLFNAKIIEIGSFEGLSLSHIKDTITTNKNQIWCVEPFLRKKLKINTNNWGVNLINKTSKEASQMFEDNFFDLIFIDGDHSYENVKKDIESWLPKLKNNGIMSGHDYDNFWTGVVRAVDEKFYGKIKTKNRIWWTRPKTLSFI